MNLALYSSLAEGQTPNLLALQDELLSALPTVLVCPSKEEMELTAVRVEISWHNHHFIACPELTRPIRGKALRPMGQLDAELSGKVMERFLLLLAQ